MALNISDYYDYARPIQHHRGEYKTSDSPENLIRYITRTRSYETEETKKEVALWGTHHGYFYHKSPEDIISEFKCIQKLYKAKGSLMCHYTFSISFKLFSNMRHNMLTLGNYAVDCCRYLFELGYQSCFAIHSSEKTQLHIHFVINTINFRTGKKLRQYPVEIYHNLEVPMLKLLDPYII